MNPSQPNTSTTFTSSKQHQQPQQQQPQEQQNPSPNSMLSHSSTPYPPSFSSSHPIPTPSSSHHATTTTSSSPSIPSSSFSSYFNPFSSLGSYVYSMFSSSSPSSRSSELSSHSFASPQLPHKSSLDGYLPASYPIHSSDSLMYSPLSDQLEHRARSESILSVLSSESTLSFKNRNEETKPVLIKTMTSSIRRCLPASDKVADTWVLLYSLDQHGASLHSLYQAMQKNMEKEPLSSKSCLLLIQDSMGKVFGAYLTDPLKPCPNFYGTGETFVFEFDINTHEIISYPWTGQNEYFIYCEQSYFGIGSGEGHYAIFLDSNLELGKSHPAPTFNNPILATGQEFLCIGLEVWGFE